MLQIALKILLGCFTILGFENEIGEINIYSITGIKLISFKQNISETIDISAPSAGIYFMEILTDSGIRHLQLVKE